MIHNLLHPLIELVPFYLISPTLPTRRSSDLVVYSGQEGIAMARTSDKHEKILAFLNRYIEENGYPPAVREIGAAVGLKSTATVSYHLGELKRQGRIQADSGKRRAISLPEGQRGGKIPVLGVVTAG